MASNTSLCKICHKRNISKVATDWCGKCNGGLCLDCKQIHDAFPDFENHVTISLSESSGVFLPIKEVKCQVHDDKYQLLCRSHDQMACLTCLENHSSCKDVVSLTNIVGGVKESELYQDAETGLSNTFDNMSTMENVLNDNYDSINGDKTQLKAEVKTLCDQAVDHIRKAQLRMETEIDNKSEEAKSTILETTNDLKKKKSNFTELKSQLRNTKTYGSDMQMFVILREIIKKTHENDEHFRTLKKPGKTDKVTLSFKSSDIFGGILKMDKLGTIDIKHVPKAIKLKQSKEKQAQFALPKMQSRSFDDIKLNCTTSFNHPCRNLTGLSVLPDGKILLCDTGTDLNEKKIPIAVVNEAGQLVSTIPIPGKFVYDVAVIDQNTIAVTTYYGKTVSVVDIPSSSIKRSISTANRCHGITYFNHHLYCCVYRKGIDKISVKTGQTSAFYSTNLPDFAYITFHNNKLYFIDRKKHSVICCDMERRQIWIFEDPSLLKSIRAIAVCKFSNIFIADYGSSSVVLLSEDGKKSRKILTKDDGLILPQAVFYDSELDRLIVGDREGQVFIYNFV